MIGSCGSYGTWKIAQTAFVWGVFQSDTTTWDTKEMAWFRYSRSEGHRKLTDGWYEMSQDRDVWRRRCLEKIEERRMNKTVEPHGFLCVCGRSFYRSSDRTKHHQYYTDYRCTMQTQVVKSSFLSPEPEEFKDSTIIEKWATSKIKIQSSKRNYVISSTLTSNLNMQNNNIKHTYVHTCT